MFVFAIETNGKTVAFTKEVDLVMLNGILNGAREEGQHLRDGLFYLRDKIGASHCVVWDGVSPFTARLATEYEALYYDSTAAEHLPEGVSDESLLMFCFTNLKGENSFAIPPTLHRAARNHRTAIITARPSNRAA
jgi:hypothetical protein